MGDTCMSGVLDIRLKNGDVFFLFFPPFFLVQLGRPPYICNTFIVGGARFFSTFLFIDFILPDPSLWYDFPCQVLTPLCHTTTLFSFVPYVLLPQYADFVYPRIVFVLLSYIGNRLGMWMDQCGYSIPFYVLCCAVHNDYIRHVHVHNIIYFPLVGVSYSFCH